MSTRESSSDSDTDNSVLNGDKGYSFEPEYTVEELVEQENNEIEKFGYFSV